MGKAKYVKDVEILLEKSPVVSARSISMVVRSRKKVKGYVKQFTRNMVLKGRMKRLTKGFYTLHDDPSLAVFCFKPSYLGLQDAMSFHNLWEQEAIPIIVTTRRVRQGIRKVLDTNVLIRRINKKYFFGFDYYKQDSFCLPYSDIEKTFIDMIYFKEKISKELIRNIAKKADRKKINLYLKNYTKKIRERIKKLLKTET